MIQYPDKDPNEVLDYQLDWAKPGRSRLETGETLTASEEVDRALTDATERLKADTSEEIYEEQQRLIEAQQGLLQRLAQLAGTD